MREHPIPQDITGYRFHIIGSMTLKQFGELGAGALSGLLIYATNLPSVIKWPLIALVVAIGAAAAFLPFEERTLDHWITTFIKVMYRPTKYFWKRSQKIPPAFLYEPGQINTDLGVDIDLGPARRQRIKEYLTSVDNSVETDQFDLLNQQRLSEIMAAFDNINTQQVEITKQKQRPQLKVRTRSLEQEERILDKEKEILPNETSQAPLDKRQLSPQQVAQDIDIPVAEDITVQVNNDEEEASEEINLQPLTSYIQAKQYQNQDGVEQQATFNTALPFPSRPDQPNKLVGMILTSHNELIPDAIVEIHDEQGRVVRAVKSNALGQFFISTPLRDGSYTIYIEHDNYQFEPSEITLTNEIVDPVEIRSLT